MEKKKIIFIEILVLILLLSNVMATEMSALESTILTSIKPLTGYLETSTETAVRPLEIVSGSDLAENSGLNKNQICFGLGDFAYKDFFEIEQIRDEQILFYKGEENLDSIKTKTVCGNNAVNLSELLEEYPLNFSETGLPDCELCGDEKCCAVMLTYSKGEENIPNVPVSQMSLEEALQKKNKEDFQKELADNVGKILAIIIPALLIIGGLFFIKQKKIVLGIILIMLAIGSFLLLSPI